MRRTLLAAWLALVPVAPALAYTGVSIGINIPVYPRLVAVPGYPVYYAPNLPYNYFFYDGMYWDFDGDNWYYSRWYNGPWELVDPYAVPLYLLQVPVRYYHRPPAYFRGWAINDAPRWHEHWGRSWVDRRHDWNDGRYRRDYRAERAAPLPHYQRQYSQRNYPAPEQQRQLADRSYRYQPREQVVQQHYRGQYSQAPQQQSAPQRDQAAPQYPRGEARGEGRHEGRDHRQER